MNRRNLSLHPDYLKNGIALQKIKKDFKKWADDLRHTENLNTEKAIALTRAYNINVPRLITYDFDSPITLYRTRVISTGSDADLSDPQQFSYPPASACETFQRANAPGFPAFYGAIDGQTAMEELTINGQKIQKNDTIFLSKWRMKKDVRFNYANLTMTDIVEKHQMSAEITRNVFQQFSRLLQNQDDLFARKQDFLFRETSALFLKGSHVQSGTIAHDILYHTEGIQSMQIHGIMYPSVCNDFRSVNFALHPDFVNSSLELESVQKFTFKEFSDGGGHGNASYFGKLENGRIVWTTLFSELMIHDFRVELSLDPGWTAEEIDEAKFIFNGEEINLTDYCTAKVDQIDLSKNVVKQEHIELYQNNAECVFLLDQSLDDGIAYLKLDERINGINLIRISIPFFTRTKVVDPKTVLNSTR